MAGNDWNGWKLLEMTGIVGNSSHLQPFTAIQAIYSHFQPFQPFPAGLAFSSDFQSWEQTIRRRKRYQRVKYLKYLWIDPDFFHISRKINVAEFVCQRASGAKINSEGEDSSSRDEGQTNSQLLGDEAAFNMLRNSSDGLFSRNPMTLNTVS